MIARKNTINERVVLMIARKNTILESIEVLSNARYPGSEKKSKQSVEEWIEQREKNLAMLRGLL